MYQGAEMKETKRLRQYQKHYNYILRNTKSFNPLAFLKMELKGVKRQKPQYTKQPKIQIKKTKKEIPVTYEEGCCYESRILDWNEYGI